MIKTYITLVVMLFCGTLYAQSGMDALCDSIDTEYYEDNFEVEEDEAGKYAYCLLGGGENCDREDQDE